MIAFLDADDEWTQNYIEIILKLREQYPQAGMYTTAYQILTHNGKLTWPKYKYIPVRPWEGLLPNFFKSLAFGDSPVRTSLLSVPKSIFIELGGFPPGYRWAHDVDLFGKIALKYPVAFSWKLGGIYHGDAVNRLSDLKRPIDYNEPFIETARNAIINGEARPDFIGPLNEFIFRQETPRVARYILSGSSETARNILSQCKPKQYYYYSIKILLLILSIIPYPVIRYSINIKFLKIALMELFHISPEAKYSQGLYR